LGCAGVVFALFQHGFGVAAEVFEAQVAHRDAEVVAGDVFELVGFVEDDRAGLGNHAGVGRAAGHLADGEVGEEEVVVDDDDVRFLRFAAHFGDEAALVVGAGLAEAGFAAGVDARPERARLGNAGKLGAVAGFGGLFPLGDLVELVDFLKAGQDWMALRVTSLWRQR
jgi:hypothetical protein